MAVKWHPTKDGTGVSKCDARKQTCPNGGDSEHFATKKEALAHVEAQAAEENASAGNSSLPMTQTGGKTDDATKGGTGEQGDEVDQTRYSFLKKFKESERVFKEDFEGVPKRFFGADLRGKNDFLIEDYEKSRGSDPEETDELVSKVSRYRNSNQMWVRLTRALSSPQDNDIEDAQVEKLINGLDHAGFSRADDDALKAIQKRDPKAQRAWIVGFRRDEPRKPYGRGAYDAPAPPEDLDKDYIVITDSRADTSASTGPKYYHYSGTNMGLRSELPVGAVYMKETVRGLAGSTRLANTTGHENMLNVLPHLSESSQREAQKRFTKETFEQVLELEQSQQAGKNFLANQKYIRDNSSGSVATAFEDKKNPSSTHQEAMESTTMAQKNGGGFYKVEIDNDVDLEEYKDFEKAYHEIAQRLPQVPQGRTPDLRIRKLGKHSSATNKVNGLFNPVKNSVVLDVSTSEAFIHEMSHHYDIVGNDNASLSEDFKPIVSEYSRNLKVSDPKRRDYLETPTEIFARLSERYFHEKKGINNRLINPEKFSREDYRAFDDSPGLKEAGFAYLDTIYGK